MFKDFWSRYIKTKIENSILFPSPSFSFRFFFILWQAMANIIRTHNDDVSWLKNIFFKKQTREVNKIRKYHHHHLAISFSWLFWLCVSHQVMNILKRILHNKKAIFIYLPESPLPFRIFICKRPAGRSFATTKRTWKMHLETLQNEKKCVLSIKESNFNGKHGSKVSHLLIVKAKGADPLMCAWL